MRRETPAGGRGCACEEKESRVEDLLKLFESIRRWKWLVLAVGVVAMVAALALALSKESSWTATSTLIVGAASPENRAPEDDANVARGYVEGLLNTTQYQDRLAERANLPDDVEIEGGTIAGTALMEINATASTPEEAISAATVAAETFVDDIQTTIEANLSSRLDPLRERLRDVAGEIPGVQAQLADRSSLSAAQVTELEGRLFQLQTDREALQGALQEGTSTAGNPNLVGIVNQPTVATENEPNVLNNAVLGLLGGLVLGGAIALVLGALELRITSPNLVRSKLGLQTLGSISGADPRQRQEDLQGLASRVALMGGGVRSVAVTSPGIREGKTLVASNFARYRAALGDRVVLIDANLRSAAETAPMRDVVGLAQILADDDRLSIADALVDSGVPNLRVIPAGATDGDPYALLTAERMGRVLESVAPFADVLVIDTAAVLTAAESQVVCSLADRTILVLDSGATPTSSAVEARDVLERINARILGVVLTQVPKRRMTGGGGQGGAAGNDGRPASARRTGAGRT